MTGQRLTNREIAVIRHLVTHCGVAGQVTLKPWQRKPAASLWRQLLVEIWYRQSPEAGQGLQGPFYGLTDRGRRLAAALYTERQAGRADARVRHDPNPVAPDRRGSHEGGHRAD
jgi:hypothetical protein